jgi:transposase
MARIGEITPSHTLLELLRLAASTKDANQDRRLLSIAAALDGMSRTDAARIGGMDRQTLRGWGRRFNTHGPAGLKDYRRRGNPTRLSASQQAELAEIVETGPDRAVDGVVRWRRADLQRVIEERFVTSRRLVRTTEKVLTLRFRSECLRRAGGDQRL